MVKLTSIINMINFNSKKVNITLYCLVSFLAVAIYPSKYDYIFSAIGEKIGAFIAYVTWGLIISGLIFLIRIIFDRKNKFDFFMNTLWWSTLLATLLGIIETLSSRDTLDRASVYHWVMGFVYTLPAIIIAIIFFYKRKQNSAEMPNFETQVISASEKENTTKSSDTDDKITKPILDDIVYYYAEDGKPIGPLTLEALIQHKIDAETLIWKAGMKQWEPAKDIPELHSYINTLPPPLA